MDPYEDPVIQGRRLRAALRSTRNAAGMTQRDLANALDWSVSKVVRIENGDTGISTTDLRALLAVCGITEQARIDELISLARMSRRQAWAPYRDLLPKSFLQLLSLEASATTVRTFEALQLPGLLQTEEYASAIIRAYPEGSSDVVTAKLVQLRMERQELLDRGGYHQFSFVIDESSLRRLVGGSIELMQRQFEHLIAVAEKPNVTLGVIPFGAGQYSGMGGSFVHLEFAGPGDDDLVYLETAYNDYLIRDALDDARRFLERFYQLEALARPAADLRRFTDTALEEMASYQARPEEPPGHPDE